MVSSYVTYTQYAHDMRKSLDRISKAPDVASETEYYKANIGTIKTVDDLLGNYRIYSYAMKANGLEDMIYAKGFMKKVLESDLTDPNSFANRLSDAKYRDFATSFDFGSTKTQAIVQTSAQQESLIQEYSATLDNKDAELAHDTSYYDAVLPTIKNVDGLFKDSTMRNYMFTAFGVDSKSFNYDNIRSIVTSDVNDPNSYINVTYGGKKDEIIAKYQEYANLRQAVVDKYNSDPTQPKGAGYKDPDYLKYDYLAKAYLKQYDLVDNYFKLAAAYNFNADGTIIDGTPVQTTAQIENTHLQFLTSGDRLTKTGALLNADYVREYISGVTTVNDLVADARVRQVLTTTYGLPYSTSSTELKAALVQDVNDKTSDIYKQGTNWVALVKDFNFQADGTLASGTPIQTDEQVASLRNHYLQNYDDADVENDKTAETRYRRYIGQAKDVNDFLSDGLLAVEVRTYALKAFGIKADEFGHATLKRVLTSDLSDPKSFVYSLKDDRLTKFAKAFNFQADGSIGRPRMAQSENEVTRISRAYITAKTKFDTSKTTKTKAQDEATYYRDQMQTLDSLDQLLGDTRLTDFVLEAEGIDPKIVSKDFLRKVMTSDLNDPKSFVNIQQDTRFTAVAGSFNFTKDGKIDFQASGSVQDKRGLYEIQNLYMRQTMEQQAGEDDTGSRLALYFKRMAPSVTNNYSIISDPALAEFVRTVFSLPDQFASVNVDKQNEVLKQRFDIKDLSDPEKVDKMINRFLGMYEVKNGSAAPNPLSILNGSASAGLSGDTLFALAQLQG